MNRRLYRILFIVILLTSCCLIVAGIFNDFWLDEIWGWAIARDARSAVDIFRVHVDTNHILNTIFMYAMGDRLWWPAYRLPSAAAGMGSLVLIGLIARRDGRPASLMALGLAGTSWLLILYFSEARGHAASVFFSLLSFYFAERYLVKPSAASAAGWTASAVLGWLSHLNYLHCYFPILIWTAYHFIRQESHWRKRLGAFTKLHAVGLVFVLAFYWLHIRKMTFGGGWPASSFDVLESMISAVFGAPRNGLVIVGAAGALLVLIVRELEIMHRENSDLWVFFGAALLVFPPAVLFVNPNHFFYVRYFLVNVVFLLLLLSRPLARAAASPDPRMKGLCMLFLAGYLIGNGTELSCFYRNGRGKYLDAVRYMADNTAGSEVTVGSAHDFAHEMMLRFYGRYLPPKPTIHYVPRERWTKDAPEWVIIHSQSAGFHAEDEQFGRNGRRYRLQKAFLSCRESGADWYIYRMAP